MKIGIDLVEIKEWASRLEQSGGAEKVFTAFELQENKTLASLAGIFAAKEAFMKAYGEKVDWLAVWIEKDEQGQPSLHSLLTAPGSKLSVSISHSGDYAAAVVILN